MEYSFKTSDGIEFLTYFEPNFSFIKTPLDGVFIEEELDHEKLFQVLYELFPSERWSEYQPIKWIKDEHGIVKDEKYNMSLWFSYKDIADILKYYQGLIHVGKSTLPKGLAKVDREYLTSFREYHKPTEEELKEWEKKLKVKVSLVNTIYPQPRQWFNQKDDALLLRSDLSIERGGYSNILDEILSPLNLMSYAFRDHPIEFKPQEFFYYCDIVTKDFHVLPALPSKTNKFIKILQVVYDGDKLAGISEKGKDLKSLKESAKKLKVRIPESRIKNIEDEIKAELIELRQMAGIR